MARCRSRTARWLGTPATRGRTLGRGGGSRPPPAQHRREQAPPAAAAPPLMAPRASRYLSVTIESNTLETVRQEKRGRPSQHTRYRKITRDTFSIRAHLNDDTTQRDAASDGCWPLITNDRTLTGAEALAAYKYQPALQRSTRGE